MESVSFDRDWLQKLLIVFLIIILSEAIIFLCEAKIGHELAPAVYGDYKVIMAVISFISPALALGLDMVLCKLLPQLFAENEHSKGKLLLFTTFKSIFLINSIWITITLIIAYLAYFFTTNYHLLAFNHPVLYCLSFTSMFTMTFLGVRIVRAIGYNILSPLLYMINSIILLFIVYTTQHTFYLNNVMGWTAFSQLVAIVIIFSFIAFKFRDITIFKDEFIYNNFRYDFNYIVQKMLSYPVASVLLILIEYMPIGEKEVGIFSSILTLLNILAIPIITLKVVFQVKVALVMKENKATIKKLLNTISWISVVFLLCSSLVIYLLLPYIFKIYGKDYSSALALIPLAMVCFLPNALMAGNELYVVYEVLTTRKCTYIRLANILFAVLLGIPLIHLFGINGAVYAYGISNVLYAFTLVSLRNWALSFKEA